MADNLTFELEGIEPLIGKLETLKQDLRLKSGRAAWRKASGVLVDIVKKSASAVDNPTTPNNIAKNVVARWSPRYFKQTGDLKFRIGILGGAKNYVDDKANRRKRRAGKQYTVGGSSSNPGGDTWYWRFIEFGKENVAARPFMRNSLRKNTQGISDAFIEEYSKGIDRALKRASKKSTNKSK